MLNRRLLVVAAMAAAETGWAKNQIRGLIIRQANQYLTATLNNGRLEGSLFRGLELYGVFTRQGVGLVIPFIDSTGVSADGIKVDRIACYGNFFFNYTDDPGPIATRVREITSRPAASRQSRSSAPSASKSPLPWNV